MYITHDDTLKILASGLSKNGQTARWLSNSEDELTPNYFYLLTEFL